jgi:adenine-specific DNA-methyltransferase
LVRGLLRHPTLRARALRRSSSGAEQALWNLLRNRKLDGAKFRRQHPLGPFIVDFYCESAKLVIEADGAAHFPKPVCDLERAPFFHRLGISVLRFENYEQTGFATGYPRAARR